MRLPDPLWQSDPIEYVVEAKFPDAATCRAIILKKESLSEAQRAILREANAYRTQLKELSPTELAKLVDETKSSEPERIRVRLEKLESERPFNHPAAAADFSFWASMSYWSPDEAIALSLAGC